MKNILQGITGNPTQIVQRSWITLLLLIISFYPFAQPDTWQLMQQFNSTPVYGAFSFNIGNKGYIVAGFQNVLWEYDPASKVWTQKAGFVGTARLYATGFSIGGKGYIGTGLGLSASGGTFLTKDFFEYDPATNAWTQKADFGGTARDGATGFSIDSKGYIGTGYDPTYPEVYQSDFWEYDPATDSWAQKSDFSGAGRGYATGFCIGSKGYIGTGFSGSPTGGSHYKDFFEYDPTTNAWTQKADFGGTGRDDAIGFSIGSKGYVGTGSEDNPTKDFWEYNPATNIWTKKADFGGNARYFATGFSIDNKGYIGWGIDHNGLIQEDFWEYSPSLENENTITTTVATDSFCTASTFKVSFTATGTFNAGNIFTAQLSDATGSFTNAVNIGSVTATTSGTIDATIPAGTAAGTGYRIRVVSSSPAFTGDDNGANLTVVVDNMAPAITGASVTPNTLWPPNRLMRDVTVNYTVTDNCSGVTTTLSVESNEPQSSNGPDWVILDNHHLQLKADRSGSGTGRIYTIIIMAEDASGNTSTQTLTVTVPHNQSTFAIGEADKKKMDAGLNGLTLQAIPNPSQHYFTLATHSNSRQPIIVRVTDVAGRLIEVKSNIAANGTIQLGNGYRPGTYFAQVIQGKDKITVKLEKQSD